MNKLFQSLFVFIILSSNIFAQCPVDAGSDQTNCADLATLAADDVSGFGSTGEWSVISGSGVFSDNSAYDATVSGLSKGANVFRWTIDGGTCYDDVTITNNTPSTADAGADQSFCADNTTLDANLPDVGTGQWSVISGSATFADGTSNTTAVSDFPKGSNVLRWTVTNGICTSTDDVTITNDLPTTANAGSDQTLCADNATLAGNNPVIGTGQWSVVSGSATFSDGTLFNTIVTDLDQGDNVLRWTITNNGCTSSDDVSITNDLPSEPDAGTDQNLCADNATLAGNDPIIGTGLWSVVSGSAIYTNSNLFNTTAINLAKGSNQLRWTITNAGCSLYDDVLITNNLPSLPDAGSDQTLCADNTILDGNSPTVGTGEWTTVSGSGTFVDNTDPASDVTGLTQGTNVFRWTISNEGCTYFDDVNITNDLPTEADAGPDQTICTNATTLQANSPVIGTGAWIVISGSATFVNSNSENTEVVDLGNGANILVWKITSGACSSTDTVIITNDSPTAANAGIDQVLCSQSTSVNALNPTIGTGDWSIVSGSGVFTDNLSYNSDVSGLSYGSNVFRWTTTNGICTSTDDVEIRVDLPSTPNAGIDQNICGGTFTVEANDPVIGTGQWSITSGAATFVDDSNPTLSATILIEGETVIRWTINSGSCSLFDEVSIFNNEPTEANAGADISTNSTTVDMNANNPTIGAGNWTIIQGSGTFDDNSLYNSTVSNLSLGDNIFRWTITNENCTSYDDIIVTVTNDVEVFAGNDTIICDEEVILNAQEPLLGSGTWLLFSGTGVFEDENQHDTKVVGLEYGENTFIWRVEYAETFYYDTVIITNNSPTTAIAGPDQSNCADSTMLEGNSPTIGQGYWSASNCQLDFQDITQNNTYVYDLLLGENILTWTIENNNCSSSDTVIIENANPSTAFAGNDQIICDDSTSLYCNIPEIGTGSWSVLNGGGNFSSNYVYDLSAGENILIWTITNNECISTDKVSIINNSPTTANAGADQVVDEDSTIITANLAVHGEGSWNSIGDNVSFENDSSNVTIASNLNYGTNLLSWTITNETCESTDYIKIYRNFPHDSVLIEIYDTTYITHYDSVTVTIYDSIAVTDTLIIDITIDDIAENQGINTIKVYPNPANDFVYIHTGEYYNQMRDYQIRVLNATGTYIFSSYITDQLFEISVNRFGSTGLFFIQIIDDSNNIMDTRKIILE